MARLLVRDRARADVEEISDRISEEQYAAAIRFLDTAEKELQLLSEFPELGPKWEPAVPRYEDLRCWPNKGLSKLSDSLLSHRKWSRNRACPARRERHRSNTERLI